MHRLDWVRPTAVPATIEVLAMSRTSQALPTCVAPCIAAFDMQHTLCLPLVLHAKLMRLLINWHLPQIQHGWWRFEPLVLYEKKAIDI